MAARLIFALALAQTGRRLCDSVSYLRNGAWRPIPPGPISISPACAPNPAAGGLSAVEFTGHKYACNDTGVDGRSRPRFAWVPAPQCSSGSWSALFRQNRTVWVIGDSMSMQTAFVLQCVASAELPGGSTSRWANPAWARFFPSKKRDRVHHRTSACVHMGSGGSALCYVAAGTVGAVSVAGALQILTQHGAARADDLALVNSGAWQMGRADGDAYQRRMVEDLKRTASHPDSPRVIWREAFAQHFPTANGVFVRRAGSNPSVKCTGTPSEQPRILAEVARELGAHPRITVLPTWHLTQHLAAAHRGRGDCSHYCNWAGVLQAVLDAFALASES
jgi:hypothetical protein